MPIFTPLSPLGLATSTRLITEDTEKDLQKKKVSENNEIVDKDVFSNKKPETKSYNYNNDVNKFNAEDYYAYNVIKENITTDNAYLDRYLEESHTSGDYNKITSAAIQNMLEDKELKYEDPLILKDVKRIFRSFGIDPGDLTTTDEKSAFRRYVKFFKDKEKISNKNSGEIDAETYNKLLEYRKNKKGFMGLYNNNSNQTGNPSYGFPFYSRKYYENNDKLQAEKVKENLKLNYTENLDVLDASDGKYNFEVYMNRMGIDDPESIKTFQRNNLLPATGVVDAQTYFEAMKKWASNESSILNEGISSHGYDYSNGNLITKAAEVAKQVMSFTGLFENSGNILTNYLADQTKGTAFYTEDSYSDAQLQIIYNNIQTAESDLKEGEIKGHVTYNDYPSNTGGAEWRKDKYNDDDSNVMLLAMEYLNYSPEQLTTIMRNKSGTGLTRSSIQEQVKKAILKENTEIEKILNTPKLRNQYTADQIEKLEFSRFNETDLKHLSNVYDGKKGKITESIIESTSDLHAKTFGRTLVTDEGGVKLTTGGYTYLQDKNNYYIIDKYNYNNNDEGGTKIDEEELSDYKGSREGGENTGSDSFQGSYVLIKIPKTKERSLKYKNYQKERLEKMTSYKGLTRLQRIKNNIPITKGNSQLPTWGTMAEDVVGNTMNLKKAMGQLLDSKKKYGGKVGNDYKFGGDVGYFQNYMPDPYEKLEENRINIAKAQHEINNSAFHKGFDFFETLAPQLVTLGTNALDKKFAKTNAAMGGVMRPNMQQGAGGAEQMMNRQNVPVEVEGNEMAELPNKELIKYKGPSHEEGGIPDVLPEGTRMYSDKIKVSGITMSERKEKRAKREMKLEDLLEMHKTDKLIANAHKRVMETNKREDMADMKIQDVVSKIMEERKQMPHLNGGKMPDDAQVAQNPEMPQAQGMQPPVKQYEDGGEVEDDNDFDDYSNANYSYHDAYHYNGGSGKKDGIAFPSVTADTEDDTDFDNYINENRNYHNTHHYNNVANNTSSTTTPTTDGTEKTHPYLGTIGDNIGLLGDTISTLSPYYSAIESRASDIPQQNYYEGYGREALQKLGSTRGLIDQNFDTQKRDLDLLTRGAIYRQRNGARGINQLRDLDLAAQQTYNKSYRELENGRRQSLAQLIGQESQLEANIDLAERQGAEKRDEGIRADIGAYQSALAQGKANIGTGIQTIASRLNQIRTVGDANTIIEKLKAEGYSEAEILRVYRAILKARGVTPKEEEPKDGN